MAKSLGKHVSEPQQHSLIKIFPSPQTNYAGQGLAVLATNTQGQIVGDPSHGFFVHETRMISRWAYSVNGKAPTHVVSSNVEQHSWLGYYGVTPPGLHWEKDTGSGKMQPLSEQTVEIRVSRSVGLGLHEDVDLINFSQEPSEFELAVEVAADFADQAETEEREQLGKLRQSWKSDGSRAAELCFDYRASHHYFHQGNVGHASIYRGISVRVENADSKPKFSDGAIRFRIRLRPRQSWHACLKLTPEVEGKKMPPLYGCHAFFTEETELDRRRRVFLQNATQVKAKETENLASVVINSLRQAMYDLSALRIYEFDRNERSWVPAAGLPIYLALFGRDTLTAAWQSAIISRDIMSGTLPELVRWQGKVVNDWRDEQPGRMLHEAHTGPLASLGYNPRNRYYGATTTSSFFPVVVAELWHWTGDKSLVKPLLGSALKALRWKDKYANLEADGFAYYQTRSEQGNKNQAWKDSADAIVYEDGSQVETPIATCEEQAYVYVSKLHLSEVLWWMGETDLARQLFHEAGELKKRFNEAFWMPDEKFFALGLDSRRRPIRSISSNPGDCLACGIVDHHLARTTADRLMTPELFSGWGIRTLSREHPAFDPYSYHRGSVWPVEQGSIALGFTRYGLNQHTHRLTRALFDATTLFPYNRLPEVFGGQQRDRLHPFPALYPKTNWPQAWSASSLFSLLQSMVGLYPFAPMNMLLLDPHLPDWLPEITLENLSVGSASVSLRFFRKGDRTHFEVLDKKGKLHVVRQPSPWSLTATFAERVYDLVSSLAA